MTVVDCSTLTRPANGQVSHTAGTTFGQTATYSCDTGFNLVGNSIRTCEATGLWSGSTPTCQGTFMWILEASICLCKLEDRGHKNTLHNADRSCRSMTVQAGL